MEEGQLKLERVNRDSVIMNHTHNEESEDGDLGLATVTAKPQLKQPSLYKVIMLNDDYTPMDFVIEILMQFFYMDMERASATMLAVHHQGYAVCGVYPKDIAETKAAQVVDHAREHQHPLMCQVEAAESE